MTYEELKRIIELLEINGYMKKEQPIWDMDMYQMLNVINKELK